MATRRIRFEWGPLTREESIEVVTQFLLDAGEAVSGADLAQAFLAATKEDEEARTAVYDELHQRFGIED